MHGITEKQNNILNFVRDFIQRNQYSPSVREIGEHFSISVKAVQDQLMALKKKGMIKSQRQKPRTITIVNEVINGA